MYSSVFAVGATNSSDAIAGFSSRGPSTWTGEIKPDVTAPGVSVRSTTPGDNYGFSSGTSMAGPHVAGAVALLLDARPALLGDLTAIGDLLRSSATPLTSTETCGGVAGSAIPNNTYGHGRIDVWSAITRQMFLPTVPAGGQ